MRPNRPPLLHAGNDRVLGTLTMLALLAALLAGCTTAAGTRRSLNPLDWLFGRKATAVATTEAKQDTAATEIVHAAQLEVLKTGAALAAAREENPQSRPVEVAQRTNGNAAALLAQQDPLSMAEQQAALQTVRGLLSTEVAAREKAEQAQAAAEGHAAKLSEQLADLRTRLEALRGEAVAEAADNLKLANQLRAATIWKWTSTGGAMLLGVLALAYRYNLGNLQTGVGQALGRFQAKYGTKDDDLLAMQHAIDALTGKAQQNAISTVANSILKT